MPSRLRKPLLIIGGLAIVLLILAGAVLLWLSMLFSDIAKNGFILPQDCNGTSVHVSGTVHDVSSAAIEITAGDFLAGDSGLVKLKLTADAKGKFDSGSTKLPVFICEPFDVTISAQGFETKQITYWVQDHFSEARLGDSISSGNPLPVVLDIELQRSK